MLTNPLQRLEPIHNPLLVLIFEHVDDSMLLEIAQADYGEDVEIHLAALDQTVAMLLLWVSLVGGASSLEHRDPELVGFLISVAHCNENFPISREIDECQRSQKWRDAIESILLDPTASDYAHSNPELQNFGMELLVAAGLN